MSNRPMPLPSAPALSAAVVTAALLTAATSAAPLATAPTLEYLAHAAFVVQSPGGTRVAIDPYNSERWLGYGFPDRVSADAVLVSHPHYDHDAAYYFDSGTPAFRKPGRYTVGDIVVEGHEGRHADPYGKDFDQINTVWVVETGGVRIAHLGDNGPGSPALLTALGRIDVLLAPADATEHILTYAALDGIRAALKPRVTVPMHYRLDGFHDLPESLGAVGVDRLPRVRQVGSHRLALDADVLGHADATLVLAHSPAIRAWTVGLREAWRLRDSARVTSGTTAASPEESVRTVSALEKAAALAPGVIVFQYELAHALHGLRHDDEAAALLERALASAAQQDAEYVVRARALLAELYAARGQRELAAAQYRLILAESPRPAFLRAARVFFDPPQR